MEPTNTKQSDYTFKILLIGESGVGKTAILERYCDNIFNDTLLSTVGVDFKAKYISIENKTIKIQLWDTAGQEKFRNITSSYYRGTHGCVVVFDVNDLLTFEKINFWLNELKNEKQQPEIIIFGNKTDLNQERVTQEMIDNFVKQNGNIKIMYGSAKTGEGIEGLFQQLIESIYHNKDIMSRMRTTTNTMQMEDVNVANQKQGGCC